MAGAASPIPPVYFSGYAARGTMQKKADAARRTGIAPPPWPQGLGPRHADTTTDGPTTQRRSPGAGQQTLSLSVFGARLYDIVFGRSSTGPIQLTDVHFNAVLTMVSCSECVCKRP